MQVRDARRVLPRVENVADDFIHADAILHLREDEWTIAAHLLRVAFHHL